MKIVDNPQDLLGEDPKLLYFLKRYRPTWEAGPAYELPGGQELIVTVGSNSKAYLYESGVESGRDGWSID